MSLLAAVLESAMDAIVVVGEGDRVELFNASAERMFGLPAGRALGQPVARLFPDGTVEAYRGAIAQLASIGVGNPSLGGTWPVQARRADGSLFPAEASIARALGEGREVHVLVVRDASSQHRALTALRESENRFRSLADHAPIMIWESDAQGRLHYFNRASLEWTGRSLSSKSGSGWSESVLPGDLPRILVPYEEAHRLRRKFTAEYRYRRADGAFRWVRASGTPRFGADGVFLGLIGTTLDIDDWRQAEAGLRRLNDELEHRVTERTAELTAAKEELEAFSYSVAHDLRAPLRAINGYSGQLATVHGETLGESGRRYLDRLQASSRRLERLISDLLQVARAGRQGAAAEPVDLGALARSVAEEHLAAAPRRPALHIGCLPRVLGEAAPLRQVLHNLIGNALKFSAAVPCPEISVASMISDNEIIISVRDNGAGFDAEYADKLFGVFQRLHAESEFEGSGVGLAIVQRIVRRHGGRAWGEGRVGEGATFRFSLPVERLLEDQKRVKNRT
jgi:PAS domain S-box-containing protein